MPKLSTLAVVFSLLSALTLSTGAAASDWSVASSAGEVWIVSGGIQRAALSSGTELTAGGALATGRSGRVLLVNGRDTITVGPNSMIVIPAAGGNGHTAVLQQAGVAEFDVEKQSKPHFAVETPYLAAIVKGTHFVVSVGAAGGSVEVQRGVVEVTDLRTGRRADVMAGQRAVVGQSSGLSVNGAGGGAASDGDAPLAPLLDLLFGTGTGTRIGLDLAVGGGVELGLNGLAGVDAGGGSGLSVDALDGAVSLGIDGGGSVDVGVGGLDIDLGAVGGLLR
jgi:hypothetical protein